MIFQKEEKKTKEFNMKKRCIMNRNKKQTDGKTDGDKIKANFESV